MGNLKVEAPCAARVVAGEAQGCGSCKFYLETRVGNWGRRSCWMCTAYRYSGARIHLQEVVCESVLCERTHFIAFMP